MDSISGTCHKPSIATHTHQEPYKYDPLEDPSDIRVLELIIHDKQLECCLRQINVAKGGYQALSYVWGSDERPFHITIRDTAGNPLGYIGLTDNLHKALHDLWSAQDVNPKTFWIDQICINQNGDEKNSQVALMHEIYSCCDGVITYLGHAADPVEHQRCCELLLQIHDCFLKNYDRYYTYARIETIQMYLQNLPVMQLEPKIVSKLTKQNWEWLSKVAAAEWHTRLWIVQEQLLSRSIIMLYGDQTLPWDAIVLLAVHSDIGLLSSEKFSRLESEPEEFSHSKLMLDMWHHRQRCFVRLEGDLANSKLLNTLLYNIRAYRSLRCRDVRDHVYALLAVSSDTIELGITPDYGRHNDIRQLCIDLTIRILQKDGHLHALQYVNTWQGTEDLTKPSWVIDVVQSDKNTRDSLNWNKSVAHPTRMLSYSPSFIAEEQTLTLKGRILDTIDAVVASFPSYQSKHPGADYIATAIDHLCKVARLLLIFNTDMETAALICRVLIGETLALSDGIEEDKITESQAFHIWAWLHSQIAYISKDISAVLDKRSDSWMLNEFDVEFAKVAPHFYDDFPGKIQEAGLRFSRGRSFEGRSVCLTANTRTGNIPDIAQKNDVIASLEGGHLLYVLRPAGEKYQYIGTAYVEGLMNGEAYAEIDADQADYDLVLV
jgi:hypothetical protein